MSIGRCRTLVGVGARIDYGREVRWTLPGLAVLSLVAGCYLSHPLPEDGGGPTASPTASARWLAYYENDGTDYAVHAVTANGAAPILVEHVREHPYASWAPTGRRLAVIASSLLSAGTVITLHRFDGGGVIERREWSHPEDVIDGLMWSPDGRWVSTIGLSSTLRVLDAEAWESTPALVFDRGATTAMEWSPSGSTLAFMVDEGTERSLFLARADDGFAPRVVTLPPGARLEGGRRRLAWSPDGRWISFRAHLGSGVRIFVADERERRAMLASPDVGAMLPSASLPTWSPDGSHLFYSDASEADPAATLFAVAVTGEGAEMPIALGPGDSVTRWTSGRRMLRVEGSPWGEEVRGIEVALTSGSAVRTERFRRSAALLGAEVWPDPLRAVLWLVEDDGRQTIALWDAARSTLTDCLTADEVSLERRGFSPDWERFVFSAIEGDESALYELRTATGELTRIAGGVHIWRDSIGARVWPFSSDGEGYFFMLDEGARDVRFAIRDVRAGITRTVLADQPRVVGWEDTPPITDDHRE